MSFLNLAGLGFLGLLPVIVLFYILKLRRAPQVVPSTLFWRKAVEDLTANAPFQKLRRNLLMYLQLLLVALLALALARPLMNLDARDGRALIVLIDRSASMATEETSGETRFEMAKARAGELVDRMLDGDSMMLIGFAKSAELLQTFTRDKTLLRNRLADLKQTHERSNLADAYLLARNLAAKREEAEIVIVSDGALEAVPASISSEKPVPVRFVKTGLLTENIGFATVDLRQAPENPRDFQLFFSARNFGAVDADTTLELRNNDKLVDARALSIPAGGAAQEIIDGAALEEGTLVLSLGSNDAFPVDDNAFLVLRKPEKTRVLLATEGNYFLEKAIAFDRALNSETTVVSPGAFNPADAKNFDVVIVDSFIPPSIEKGNYLFINAVPPLEGFDAAEESIKEPPIVDWKSDHPVMRFVELSDVSIIKALDLTLPAASLTLAETAEGRPLVAWTSVDNRNVVLYAFDIFDTNLPLRMAFPLLISNTLHWLSQGKAATQASFHRSGDVVELHPGPEAKSVRVTPPDGKTINVPIGELGTAAYDSTGLTGFHQVEVDGKELPPIAVNLLNESESRIEPRSTIEVEGNATASDERISKVNTEIWRWFAIAVLALALVEWWVYHRRVGL